VQIIVPAYNVKADQATRYEAQIASIMHMKRNEEINRFKDDKLPHATPQATTRANAPKLPEAEVKKTGSAKGRENSKLDELIIKMLKNRELSASEIANIVGVKNDNMRHILARLLARGELIKRNTGYITLFKATGKSEEVQTNKGETDDRRDGLPPHANREGYA